MDPSDSRELDADDLALLSQFLPDDPPAAPARIPVGVRLPPPAWPVLHLDGRVDEQATARAQIQELLPAVASLVGQGYHPPTVLAALQAMPLQELQDTLARHAADSFVAFAQQGGAAPDLATVAAALQRIRDARMVLEPQDRLDAPLSAVHGELMAQYRQRGLSSNDLDARFVAGRSRGAANECLFDSLYQLAVGAGHQARLQPFTGGAVGEAGRTPFAARMQELLAQGGLLARRGSGYDQFEIEGGSLQAQLLAQVTGLRLVLLNQTEDGRVQLDTAVNGTGPDAFIRRDRTAGTDGHFVPLIPRPRR
jgi:hypothetical protein